MSAPFTPMFNTPSSERPASSPLYGGLRDGSVTAVLVGAAATAAQSSISHGGSDAVGAAVGTLIQAVGPAVIGLAAGAITGLFTFVRKKMADKGWL